MNVYMTRINGLSFGDTTQYMQYMTARIAHQLGMREMGIYRYNSDAESAEHLNVRMDGIIAGINRGDLVICQFPTGNGLRFETELIRHLKAYGSRVAVFLQDLEPLRCAEKRSMLPGMINLYNQAEVLIVPSLAMRQFLLDNCIRKDMKFVIQEMWDYVHSTDGSHAPAFKKEIAYMDSGSFEGMREWRYAVPLKLYAPAADTGEGCNVRVMGGMNPDELWMELSKGGFGLVWYQNRCDREYMANSTSFSLAGFLSAGIPVIVPAGISVEAMVKKNHLGLVAGSLDEAAERVEAMSGAKYQEYVRCVEEFAPVLRSGYYTAKCLAEAVQMCYRKDAGRLFVPGKVYRLEHSGFSYTVLRESYGGNLALSWSYQGNADGFLVCDAAGTPVDQTDNMHQHYCLIKGYGSGDSFIVKAYVETLRGRMVVAESERTPLGAHHFERPVVSLIIPAYNAQEYISRSIDTALAQSFPDLELIIVDDGSTDRTMEVLGWYEKTYPNVIVIHQENAGTPAARNTGIKRAAGEYIGFMDNDDMLHPDMVARLYQSAKRNDCDIAITSVHVINHNGYEVLAQYPMEEDTAVSVEDFFDMHFTKGYWLIVVIWNKLYRASLVKEHPFPILVGDDDAWTPYILSYAERICYRNDCSYEWDRVIRSSTLSDEWENRSKEELFITYKNIVMFYLENSNPARRGLLKQLAKKQLSELGRVCHYGKYEELWSQICQ